MDNKHHKFSDENLPKASSGVPQPDALGPIAYKKHHTRINRFVIISGSLLLFFLAIFLITFLVNNKETNRSEADYSHTTQASFISYPNIDPDSVLGFDNKNNLWLIKNYTNQLEKYNRGFNSKSEPIVYPANPKISPGSSDVSENGPLVDSIAADGNNNIRYSTSIEQNDNSGGSYPETHLDEILASDSGSKAPIDLDLGSSMLQLPNSISQEVQDVTVDNSGNFWVTSQNTGIVDELPARGFPDIKPIAYSLPGSNGGDGSASAYALPNLTTDPSGNAWVDGFAPTVIKIPAGSGSTSSEQFFVLPSGFDTSSLQPNNILSDKKGNIWVSSGDNLAEVPAGSKPNSSAKEYPLNGGITDFTADGLDNIWVALGDNAIDEIPAKGPSDSATIVYSIKNNFNNRSLNTGKCDNDSDCQQFPFNPVNPLEQMVSDAKGNLWIPDWNQIIEISGGQASGSSEKIYNLPTKLKTSNILIDNDGNAWFTNNVNNLGDSTPPPSRGNVFTELIPDAK